MFSLMRVFLCLLSLIQVEINSLLLIDIQP